MNRLGPLAVASFAGIACARPSEPLPKHNNPVLSYSTGPAPVFFELPGLPIHFQPSRDVRRLCEALLENLPQNIHYSFEQGEDWSQQITIELRARSSEGTVRCFWEKSSAEHATQSIPYSPEDLAKIVRRSFAILDDDLVGIEIRENDPSRDGGIWEYEDFFLQDPVTGNVTTRDTRHPDGIVDSVSMCGDDTPRWCYPRYWAGRRPTSKEDVPNIYAMQKRFSDRVTAMRRLHSPRNSRKP